MSTFDTLSEVRAPAAAESAQRLMSLDALRGFDMFWITGGDIVAAALIAFTNGRSLPVEGVKTVKPFLVLQSSENHPVAALLSWQLKHAPWEGFRFEDLIFPMFVFIAGASLVFSLMKTLAKETRAVAARRVVTRTLVLFVIGIFFSGGFANGVDHVRWMGVLQRIALAYGGAGLLFLYLKPRGLIVACAALLLGYWALLTFVPVPGFGAADFAEGHNLTNYLDQQYLGGRKWDGDHDPEGLLSTLPAIASCLMGVFAGLWLRGPAAPNRKVLVLIASGAVALALGWAWHPWFPVIKKLWTSSFVLVAAGWSAMLLGVFYWIVDVRGWRRWAQPWVWIGLNPITIYILGSLIDKRKLAARFTGGDLQQWLNGLTPGTGDLLSAAMALSFTFLIAWFLHRRKIYLRV
jgi:predicted acyltransferase